MKLRDIKKDIEYVLGAFIEDCSLVGTVNPNVDEEALAGLFDESVDLFNDLKDRVNAKGLKRADFTQIRKDLLVKTDELYEKLSKAVKESVSGSKPEAEKKHAAKKAAPKAEKAVEEKAEKKPAAKKPAAKKPAAKKAAPKAEKAE